MTYDFWFKDQNVSLGLIWIISVFLNREQKNRPFSHLSLQTLASFSLFQDKLCDFYNNITYVNMLFFEIYMITLYMISF